MPSRCVAAYCSNVTTPSISLFKFPKDDKVREKWVQNVRRTRGPAKGQKAWTPTPYSVLCSAHFVEDCFDPVPGIKKTLELNVQHDRILLSGAIPSIFPRGSAPPKAKPAKSRESNAVAKRRELEILQECLSSEVVQKGESADSDAPVAQVTGRRISEVCVVQGCSRTSQLQSFPSDPALRQQWKTCLVGRLKHPVNPSSRVCSAHFTADCFMNWQQKQSGLAPNLTLKADALPTLFIVNSNKMHTWPLERRSVACQCDPPRKSIGTQLSKSTLLSVRSKATQTPAVTHISLDESMDFMASGAKPTMRKSRESKKSVSSLMLNGDTLVAEAAVQIASLLQLFQRCLGCCSQVCRITTRREGPVLHVVQQCWTCSHSREWASHPPDHLFTHPAHNHQAAEEAVERSCEDTDIEMEEEMREEEEEEEEKEEEEKEEEEQEERKSKRKRKRKDSDDEWAPEIEESMQTSEEESGSEEEEDRPFSMAWCRDCGKESSTCCSEQDHHQLYCCVQCGYREDHQGPACTDGQETQNMDNPKAPTPSNQGVTCDVKQEADSNHKQTASSGCLGDSNSSQGVLTRGSQHAIASGNQEAASNNQQSATSEDLNSISDQGHINSDKLHNNRNGNLGPPSNDVSELSSSKEQGSVNSSSQEVATTDGQEDTSSSDQDSNITSQLESSNSCHQEAGTFSKETHNIPMFAVYFRDLYSLQTHVEQSHGYNRELCPDCGKFIIRKDSRCSHVCDHKIKPFSCLTCGKRFTSPSGLDLHSQVHTEGHALPCRYCYKTFRFQEDKLEHEEIHSEERLKYRCPECPKRFTDRYSRSAHRKTHWKHGRYFCKVCAKGFTHSDSLKRHEVVHTGLKPYACEQCDRSFSQPGHLKSHMRVHTGEKPFKCQDCGQCFNHNVSLKNHTQRKHRPEGDEGEGEAEENGDEGQGETEEIGDDYDEYVL